jgi:tRNA-Thr(GGU) m(6)t(6)A37 methyltransferase TsaA
MTDQPVCYTPIGVVRSPFTTLTGMPIQAVAAADIAATVEVAPAYAAGLCDLDGFSHLWLLTHLHAVAAPALTVTPFLDSEPRGVFATRAPRRPNPLGLSLVRLVGVDGTTLHIEEVDLLDGTPVLDIKPYVPLFDTRAEARIGWFSGVVQRVFAVRADERFGR